MTKDQWEGVLGHPDTMLKQYLFSFVSLTKEETAIVTARFLDGMTQEQTAEKLERSVRHIQSTEKSAYRKCDYIWSGMQLVQNYMMKPP